MNGRPVRVLSLTLDSKEIFFGETLSDAELLWVAQEIRSFLGLEAQDVSTVRLEEEDMSYTPMFDSWEDRDVRDRWNDRRL